MKISTQKNTLFIEQKILYNMLSAYFANGITIKIKWDCSRGKRDSLPFPG